MNDLGDDLGDKLITAIKAKQDKLVVALINSMNDFSQKDSRQYTALMHAIEGMHEHYVSLLVQRALELATLRKTLIAAIPRISSNPIKEHLVAILGLNEQQYYGVTVLMMAASIKSTNIVSWLVKNGVDLDIQNNRGNTALHHFIHLGATDSALLLIKNGADLELPNNYGASPLMFAAYYGNMRLAKMLIEYGADLNKKDHVVGNNALHWAINVKNKNIVSLFIKQGAELEMENLAGLTALEWAIECDSCEETISLIVKQQANVNKKDRFGRTVLHRVVAKERIDWVTLLINAGARLDEQDESGQTALHVAAELNNTTIITMLITHGAPLDISDSSGMTPLFYPMCYKLFYQLKMKSVKPLETLIPGCSQHGLFAVGPLIRKFKPVDNSDEDLQVTETKPIKRVALRFRKRDGVRKPVDDQAFVQLQPYIVQIPCQEDLVGMIKLPAAEEQDQHARLKSMVMTIKKSLLAPVLTETSANSLSRGWRSLFAAINEANIPQAKISTISSEDRLLKALLAVHSPEYLQQLINNCLAATPSKPHILGSDVVITRTLFEVLVKDIATSLSLNDSIKCLFSFGLPTHHAYTDGGRGFCVLNKTAVLLQHVAQSNPTKMRYVIVGIDVNRDDGLCNILRTRASHLPICHIDIFDSRVYPWHDVQTINEEFVSKVQQHAQGNIYFWSSNNLSYHAVDLRVVSRIIATEIHPALNYALDSIKVHLAHAKKHNEQVVLFIPIGWDSHQDETAHCAKMIGDKMMSPEQARVSRFNDNDLTYFYNAIWALYKDNKQHIAKLYWGLEGGYNVNMYKRQIDLLLNSLHHSFQASNIELNNEVDNEQDMSLKF